MSGATLQQITVVGGDLFHIAAQYLGDATQYWRLMALNNLSDPFLVGEVTLTLPPPDPSQTGGLPPS